VDHAIVPTGHASAHSSCSKGGNQTSTKMVMVRISHVQRNEAFLEFADFEAADVQSEASTALCIVGLLNFSSRCGNHDTCDSVASGKADGYYTSSGTPSESPDHELGCVRIAKHGRVGHEIPKNNALCSPLAASMSASASPCYKVGP
jgi:hypothetical protein